MAGGIDWFRWHHGSVTDPKFQLVAKKANARFGDVIALWAFILEMASADSDRGNIGPVDFETIDYMLGAEEGTAVRIIDAMTARGLIVGNRVASWEKRQPNREDATAAERKRRQRERDHELQLAAIVTENESRHVTPCHADVTPCHDREEESRVDIKEANASLSADDQKLTCPVEKIVDLYHQTMPENPAVKVISAARRAAIRARWKEAAKMTFKPFGYSSQVDGLSAWKEFFEVCNESEFLTGKKPGQNGKPPFFADIDFLMSPAGFIKCIENKYHRDLL